MAITLKGATPIYQGEHGDTKPDDAPVNTIFEELDTGDMYYFTGEVWAKVGGENAGA